MPTCEAGERLGYFRNTCDEDVSGNFGKFSFLPVSLRCLKLFSGILRYFQGAFRSPFGALRLFMVPSVFETFRKRFIEIYSTQK